MEHNLGIQLDQISLNFKNQNWAKLYHFSLSFLPSPQPISFCILCTPITVPTHFCKQLCSCGRLHHSIVYPVQLPCVKSPSVPFWIIKPLALSSPSCQQLGNVKMDTIHPNCNNIKA